MFKKLKDDIKMIIRGFSVVHETQTGIILLNIILSVFTALTPFINLFLSAEILNELSGARNIKKLIILAVLTAGLNWITTLIIQALSNSLNVYNKLFEHKFHMRMNKKTLTTDYVNVENFDTRVKRQRIDDMRNMGGGGVWRLVYLMHNTISNLFIIIFAAVITYSVFFISDIAGDGTLYKIINSRLVSLSLLAVIVINVVITMYFNSSAAKKSFEIMESMLSSNRFYIFFVYQYIAWYSAGKDIRLYRQKETILEEFYSRLDNNREAWSKMGKNQFINTNINSVVSAVISLLVYLFVGFKALAGVFLVGNIVKYVGSISQFISGFSGFMNGLTEMRSNNKCLKAYFDFMEIPDSLYQGTLTTEKRADNEYDLEFRNVSFKYPGSVTYALKNLNLKITVGQKMAVVGMNGSGKTTMIKLLCRLYDPTEGEITLNGIDIKKYNYNEYMHLFSVVFQDFKLFSFSLGQNVAANVNVERERAQRCLEMAGFKERFEEMPKGLDTPLYRDFEEDGVEISGGEAQKIALARALYKDAPFIVLDEPTAALDPLAEFEIYSKFNEIAGDKTTVYISHRLSSCRFCDDIAVFHEGKLIQRGSHDTLLADSGGKYHELWNAQAQYYNE